MAATTTACGLFVGDDNKTLRGLGAARLRVFGASDGSAVARLIRAERRRRRPERPRSTRAPAGPRHGSIRACAACCARSPPPPANATAARAWRPHVRRSRWAGRRGRAGRRWAVGPRPRQWPPPMHPRRGTGSESRRPATDLQSNDTGRSRRRAPPRAVRRLRRRSGFGNQSLSLTTERAPSFLQRRRGPTPARTDADTSPRISLSSARGGRRRSLTSAATPPPALRRACLVADAHTRP